MKVTVVLDILNHIRMHIAESSKINSNSYLEKNTGLQDICNLNKEMCYGTGLMYAPLVSVNVFHVTEYLGTK